MTATNHALTGAVIGLVVASPVLAIPLAFASHFVCDAVPHFGVNPGENDIKSKWFAKMLTFDALLCVVLVLLLTSAHPSRWIAAAFCAFAAASPDFMWFGKFLKARRGQKANPVKNHLMRFHGWIQWFQRPLGVVVEFAWMVAMIDIIYQLTR